jgi:hypothetical protein
MRTKYLYPIAWLVLYVLVVNLMGCDQTASPNPTTPTVLTALPTALPVIPASAASTPGAFAADRGTSDQIGVYYDGHTRFQFQAPVGDYLLTYTTTLGDFYLVFRAKRTALITVGVQEGDLIYESKLVKGTVTATAIHYENRVVQVFSEFGARDGWQALFRRDESASEIVLLGGIGVEYTPGVDLRLTLARPAVYVLEYWTDQRGYRREQFQSSVWFETKVFPLQPGENIEDAYITML